MEMESGARFLAFSIYVIAFKPSFHTLDCVLPMLSYIERDKYLTPAPNIRNTRASHESQYTRYLQVAYSEAPKISFFPRTFPVWINLPFSVVISKTLEEFKALI